MIFNVRLDADLAERFDRWAEPRGGRSAALRALMQQACAGPAPAAAARPARRDPRPTKLTVRLQADDGTGLAAAAAAMGLTPNAWAAALIRRRLRDRPTFAPEDARSVLAIHAELHRIGVNINQVARALNTAVLEGRVLQAELGSVADFRRELRAHVGALAEALAGNLTYWQVEP